MTAQAKHTDRICEAFFGFLRLLQCKSCSEGQQSCQAAMPVQLQHEVWRKVGYAGVSLGLSLVLGCCTEVVSHDFLTSPLGQAGTERHLRQHRLTVSIVLHSVMPQSEASSQRQ